MTDGNRSERDPDSGAGEGDRTEPDPTERMPAGWPDALPAGRRSPVVKPDAPAEPPARKPEPPPQAPDAPARKPEPPATEPAPPGAADAPDATQRLPDTAAPPPPPPRPAASPRQQPGGPSRPAPPPRPPRSAGPVPGDWREPAVERPRPLSGLDLAETWRRLSPEQRAAGIGALLLIVSTFGPFSFVEAAILLVAGGILLLLRKRADNAIFHLPFGDGTILMAAGVWSAVLIVVRMFDRPLGQGLLALVCAAILILAGVRERSKRPADDAPSTRERAAREAPG